MKLSLGSCNRKAHMSGAKLMFHASLKVRKTFTWFS